MLAEEVGQTGVVVMDEEDVMNTKVWQTATSAISTTTASAIPARAWRSPLSRHLKLASFLTGCESSTNNNNNNNNSSSSSRGNNDVRAAADDPELPGGGTTHPLHVAASQNILKLGSVILSAGCAAATAAIGGAVVDPNVRDGHGRTPLHWAAMLDRAPFVQLLLERGAAVDAVDSHNRTPLLSGSALGATGAARLLLQWGADVSRVSRGGLTPLHAAAAGGHLEAVEVLIEAGADVRTRTDMGASPRHCAEKQGHADVVRVLLLLSSPPGSRSPSFPGAAGEGGEGGEGEEAGWVVGGGAAGENGLVCGRGGGGGGGGGGGRGWGPAYTEEQHATFARHSFDRKNLLLGRRLFQ